MSELKNSMLDMSLKLLSESIQIFFFFWEVQEVCLVNRSTSVNLLISEWLHPLNYAVI